MFRTILQTLHKQILHSDSKVISEILSKNLLTVGHRVTELHRAARAARDLEHSAKRSPRREPSAPVTYALTIIILLLLKLSLAFYAAFSFVIIIACLLLRKMNCAACCCIIVEGEDVVICTLEKCHKKYHLHCISDTSLINVNDWVCPECRCAVKKGGDNSLTPVGVCVELCNENITQRKKFSHIAVEEQRDCKCDMSAEILAWRQEMKDLRFQLSNAVELITKYESNISQYSLQFNDLNERLQKYEQGFTKNTQNSFT